MMGTGKEGKTMGGKRPRKKYPLEREVTDLQDSTHHIKKARKVNSLNHRPSYCLKHGATGVGNFQFRGDSHRFKHRQKLRRILKVFMLQQNWTGVSGVLSVLLRGTVADRSLVRNQNKYWATLMLLRKIKGDDLTAYKVQQVYDIWLKKAGSIKHPLVQGRLALQLESMIFSIRHQNTKDAEMGAEILKQDLGFDRNSIANFFVGLIYFQIWYSTIPEEFQLDDLNWSSTPVQSHQSVSQTLTSNENSDGPRTHMSSDYSDRPRRHMSSELSVGHDADGRDLPLEGHSSTSVGNEKKDNVYAKHDPKDSTEVNVERQDTDCAEKRGSEKSFHADENDDVPDASIFYTRGLPPWLLPLQLPQSTENMEDTIYSHKNMLIDYYKDALKHLRAALHLEPPVFEALHPLIQMLLIGDHVTEALKELESVSDKLDTLIYLRLKASLLEHFDHGDNLRLCTHFEDILKKDPTCIHTLEKLISMHQDGVYSTEELVEMLGLHLDAVMVGDGSTWKEMACCFYKLSYCVRDEISACYTQDDEVVGLTKSNAKHDDGHGKRIPDLFTNSKTKHTWQFRCRWWMTRHFSQKRLALDIASDDMELVTYKAAIAAYMYGREAVYSVKATQHLTKENKMDMLAILQMHCVGASSSGFFCSGLPKQTCNSSKA